MNIQFEQKAKSSEKDWLNSKCCRLSEVFANHVGSGGFFQNIAVATASVAAMHRLLSSRGNLLLAHFCNMLVYFKVF